MTAPKVESRSTFDRYFPQSTYYGVSRAGVDVDEAVTLSYIPMFAAIRNLSESIAQLPLFLMERQDEDVRKAVENPLYGVLHDKPNPLQTSFIFRLWMQANILLRGNAYAQIVRNVDGNVMELWPLRADRMKVEPNAKDRSKVIYEYTDDLAQKVFRIPQDQILHLRGFHAQGIVGMALADIGSDATGLGVAMETYSGSFFRNGARPGGVLEHPEALTEDSAKRLRESWERVHGGPDNQQRVAILEQGMKWHSIGISPEDSQLLDGRTYQVQEIARLFNMPPHRLQDLSRATFSNIEVQGHEYITYTLGPWLVNWEQQLSADLLTPEQRQTYFMDFNTDAFLRGQSAARGDFLFRATGGPWMTTNEARRLENMPPIEGGDVLRTDFQTSGNTEAPESDGEDENAD